ncbi:MAG TPA: AAA family ATPase [Thermoleophilaceae bacterium]|nr:AAA family ATPase [Thermoleophilaceae bacterium]
MPSPALVQRTEALRRSEALLCAPAEGGLALFEGAPGTGKSALIEAACAMASARGLTVLRAAGSEFEGDFSYGVVRQLFEPLLPGPSRSRRRSQLSRGGRAAAAALGLGGPDAAGEHAVRHALLRLLAERAAEAPVLLAIDDLDLADQASLEFLRFLAQRHAQHPIVTVATLNPGNGATGAPPISLLHIQQAAVVVRLEPLDELGVAELLAARGRPAPPELCAELARVTGGNPFLVVSVADGFSLDAPETAPPEVARHLALRLARLPTEAQQLARTASVLGDGATVATAAETTGVPPAVALDAVDALAEAGLLQRSGMIAFSAPLVRSALYGMLGHGERSRLHRRAAHALWSGGGSPTEAAEHLMRADGAAEAWATEALRRAAAEVEPAQAAAYLRRALAEDAAAGRRAELLAELAAAELSGGGSDAARHLAEAVDLLPPGRERAHACDQLACALWGLGRYAEAGRAFAEGLDDLGAELDRVGVRLSAGCVAAARVQGAAAAPRLPRPDGAALESNSDEPAMAAELALELLMAGGPRADVAALAQRALAEGQLMRRQTSGGPSFQAAVCALIWADELQVAEPAASLAIQDAQSRDIRPALGVMLLLRACARFRRGALAEAARDAEAARERVPAPLPVPLPGPDALLAEIRLEQGRPAAARDCAARAVERSAAHADSTAAGLIEHALALAARGRVELSLADPLAARSDLLECGRRLREAEVRNPAVAPWRSLAALAALRLGERERAAALVAEERDLAHAFGAARALGVALVTTARARPREERPRQLRAAIAALERSPGLLDRAYALAELGSELRRGGQRRAARDALRRALDLAVRCGAEALARRARQELVATGARPRRPRISGAGALTPRERQIAEMAADGESNRAIADRLIVSEKTIEWHLANAYRKLDIRGRGGLAGSLSES